MQTIIGYRHRSAASSDLTRTLNAFRTEALRRLAGRYGEVVADETLRLIDLHHAQIRVESPDAHPIRMAAGMARAAIAEARPGSRLDLDCALQLCLSDGAPLIRLLHGASLYQDILEGLSGLERFDFHPDRHALPGLEDWQWEERRILWEAATPKVQLATGLMLRLLDNTLPNPKWTTVRVKAPDYEKRLSRTAQAKLWIEWQRAKGQDKAAFRAWLKSQSGKSSAERAMHALDKLLPDALEKEILTSFGQPGKAKAVRAAPPAPAASASVTSSIDHADIIEGSSGDVFVAVLDAGLSQDDRVFIQVAGRQLAFVQASRDYGQIKDVPNGAIDLLRSCSEVTLIEIRRSRPEEMKARHSAIVRDLSRSAGLMLGSWKNRRRELATT